MILFLKLIHIGYIVSNVIIYDIIFLFFIYLLYLSVVLLILLIIC